MKPEGVKSAVNQGAYLLRLPVVHSTAKCALLVVSYCREGSCIAKAVHEHVEAGKVVHLEMDMVLLAEMKGIGIPT